MNPLPPVRLGLALLAAGGVVRAEVTATGAPKVVTLRFLRPAGDLVALGC
jgi:hypothetical protein